jgi:hypothetical protein
MLQELWNGLVGRAVHPKIQAGRIFEVVDEQDDEIPEADDGPPIWDALTPISGMPCIIGYVDSKGNATERLVTCQRIDLHREEQYLWAYCHTRTKVRQFRISRISEVSDPTTGETYTTVEAFFSQFSVDNHHRSQPGWGLSVNRKADLVALLNALVFVARCDKDYHSMERSSLESSIARYWIRTEAEGDPDTDSILMYADKLSPDAEIFWVSLHRCADNPMLLNVLKSSIREMIDADGHIAKEEFYWGSKVDEFVAGFSSSR